MITNYMAFNKGPKNKAIHHRASTRLAQAWPISGLGRERSMYTNTLSRQDLRRVVAAMVD